MKCAEDELLLRPANYILSAAASLKKPRRPGTIVKPSGEF